MSYILRFIMIGTCLLLFGNSMFAKGPVEKSLNKTTAISTSRQLLNIANWAYWIYDDGQSAIDPGGNSGGIYPRGTAGAIFEDGIIWGGFVGNDAQPRVGGQTYNTGTQGGRIISVGVAEDPGGDNVRIYKIRSDWETLSAGQVRQEAAEALQIPVGQVTEGDIQDVINQYAIDWAAWPVDRGAPFVDVNDNGIYEPVIENGVVTKEGDYPGIANADQVIWFVVNDLDVGRATGLYGSQPIGIELDVTLWGYNQPNAGLGQLIFKKYKFTNKSGQTINNMYISQWCDPDLGDFSDDLVGSDTLLSLGYAYNGFATDNNYSAFDLAPSAVGYDFFQGPLVKGEAGQDLNRNGVDDAVDTGIFNLKVTEPGFINLPMTSFGYFAAGSSIPDPGPLGNFEGTLEWYNLLQGFTPTDDLNNPTPFLAGSGPTRGQPTKFPVAGDPVTGEGDIDAMGDNLAPADRRMALNSGPFTMENGDVQEIIVAVVGANSGPVGVGDNIKSVASLKNTDVVAQKLFDDLFQSVPKAPPAPNVRATAFENKVVLDWGWNANAVASTEANNALTGYNFQGYNVYQLPSTSSSKDDATLIATFDIIDGVTTILGNRFLPEFGTNVEIPVQFGQDKGVQHFISIDKNFITGGPLFTGNDYIFAVTAYNYNGAPTLIEDKALESTLSPILVRTQSPPPGVRYAGTVGSPIEISRVSGGSDGQVEVTIVDPSQLTGHEYEINFTADTSGNIFWNLRDVTTGEDKLVNQPQASGLDANNQFTVDGMLIKVAGPSLNFKNFEVVANANGPLVPSEGGALDFDGFPSQRPTDRQQVGAGHWAIHTADNGSRGSYDAFLGRTTRNGGNWPEIIPFDFEMRFTDRTSQAWDAFTTGAFLEVPFELWNIGINTPDDASDDFRMFPIVIDDDESGTFNLPSEHLNAANEHSGSGSDNDPFSDWVYWYNPTGSSADEQPGEAAYLAIEDSIVNGTYTGFTGAEVMARTVLINWNGGSAPPFNQDLPEVGTVFRISSTKPNTLEDKFAFTAPAVTSSLADAKTDVEKVNVYPNPYYANNPAEIGRLQRFITFSHLPVNEKVTIRIFSLSGQQVRKLEKHNDAAANTSQFFNWDLRNENGLPVASGIYFAHVEMPSLKATKVLKIFIVQPEEILEFF